MDYVGFYSELPGMFLNVRFPILPRFHSFVPVTYLCSCNKQNERLFISSLVGSSRTWGLTLTPKAPAGPQGRWWPGTVCGLGEEGPAVPRGVGQRERVPRGSCRASCTLYPPPSVIRLGVTFHKPVNLPFA